MFTGNDGEMDPSIELGELMYTPLAPPPPGQMSNLVDPTNMAYRYYIAGTISTILMLGFVSARMYARFWHLKKGWWDDFSCVVATILSLVFTGSVIKFCMTGVGRHMWDIPLSSFPQFIFLALFISVLSAPTIAFTKLTIFLLYLRLFSVNTVVRRGSWVGIVSIILFYTVAAFMYMFQFNQRVIAELTATVGVFGVISDVYMICLPVSAIYHLNLSMRKRIGLLGVFVLGTLAIIMSLVGSVFRFSFTHHAQNPTAQDLSWKLLNILLVGTIELNIGIICSCTPAISVLFSTPSSSSTTKHSHHANDDKHHQQQVDYPNRPRAYLPPSPSSAPTPGARKTNWLSAPTSTTNMSRGPFSPKRPFEAKTTLSPIGPFSPLPKPSYSGSTTPSTHEATALSLPPYGGKSSSQSQQQQVKKCYPGGNAGAGAGAGMGYTFPNESSEGMIVKEVSIMQVSRGRESV